MIFSPRLNFNTAERRVLLLASDKATLFLGDGARLARSYVFANSEAGVAAFGAYLQRAPVVPLYVMVDVVEEEYRQDTIPFTRGVDRRAVLTRRYARLFRGTPYCLALRQGRERNGRRDERVLLTAVIKPELIAPWVVELNLHKVPLVGIYSLPGLSAALLPRLKVRAANVLLISVQQASGLRQTFFRDGQLKISRLAQMPRLGSVPYAAHLMAELAKLRRYLNSLGLMSRDSPLAVYILSHGALLTELATQCRDTDGEHYFLVDNADLGVQLRLPEVVASPYADAVFAQLLLDATPPESYAQRAETTYYRLYRAKLGLMVASALLLLGSAGWSALRFIDAVGLKQQALEVAQMADFYNERYALAHQGLPRTAVEPRDLETAVTVASELTARKESPFLLLKLIGATLLERPAVVIDKLEWASGDSEDLTARPTAVSSRREARSAAPSVQFTSAILRAHLAPFTGDYRAAIGVVDALATQLRATPSVHAVEVVEYPLDLRSGSSMTGTASSSGPANATFVLKITAETIRGQAKN